MNKKSRELREKIISYTILTLGAVVMLVPFLWMILTSFKTYAETVKIPIQWLPSVWNLNNYREVLVKLDFVRYYGNTILVDVIHWFFIRICFCKDEFSLKKFTLLYAFDCIYGSITDDDDSKVSDHHKIEMGGQFKGTCYSESIQCIYYVHAETVFCITSQGTGRCGKDRRLFLFQIVLEY